ncbi:TadE/TadG family type IV pilus assembly protein [Roseivivax sp. CAU 1753]
MMRFLQSRLAAFAKDTRGYVNVEAVIVLPILLSLFGVGWVYFDAFRQQNVNQKANYAISDILSRQTDYIDEGFIDSTFSLFQTLTLSNGSDGALRVSLVEYDGEIGGWDIVWSQTRSASGTLDGEGPDALETRLPPVIDGDQLFVVETIDHYQPALQIGLNPFDITTFSFTRPRYAAKAAEAAG